MQWKFILKITGLLVLLLGVCMILPLVMCIYSHEVITGEYLKSIGCAAIFGLVSLVLTKNHKTRDFITQKEGMVTVTLSWAAICFFGALPFFFNTEFASFTDAMFESVSGFTTTGSSIMTDIEHAPKSLLLWRSFIQWIGGMGIIVLSLAVLPFLGVGGIQLYKAEVPSPVPDKLTPRLSDSAKILWMVYIFFTLLETGLLYFGGMPLYDSLCHAFTTLPTGGFSPKNTSIAHYNNAYFEYVIVVFMILAGINFSLHYQLIRGKALAFWKDAECRFFLALTFIFALAITWDIYGSLYNTIQEAFRSAIFQVASIITTTGFASADYEKFSGSSQILLFVCMLVGASAGSTGGGIKCSRIIVCFKYGYRELFKILHPRSVSQIKVGETTVPSNLKKNIIGFVLLYIIIFFFASFLLALVGLDMVTAFGSTAACLGNIGPGFGSVGPTENFSHIPVAGKWILSFCMLMGRLELYTVIILFIPEFWRK